MSLKEFFVDETITIPFKLFGKTHLLLLGLVLVGTILIYFFKQPIFNLPLKRKKIITKSLAIFLLLNLLTLYISAFYYGNFDYKDMLPLHLCYIANYFYIYTILFNKEDLLLYSYFLSLLGPIPAIIFFNVPSVWESFNFYLYVISHHVLVIASLLTFYMYPKKIPSNKVFKLFLVLNVIYVLLSVFNHYFETNYFFSGGIPSFIITLFPFLKYIPTVLILEITEILIMFLLYKFFNREHKKITI